MRHVTNLMDKIFSDSTPDEFKASVSDKIAEAKEKGSAELKDGENHLNFTEKDGDVVIEDKLNDCEKTKAIDEGDQIKLEGVPETKAQSETQPDVVVPKVEGTDKPVEGEDSTLPDVKVTIEEAIVDKDKAGKDKHYSIVISGFGSQEEAQAAYSELFENENTLTFSDAELENVAFSATEAQETYERMVGTNDVQLAFSLLEQSEELKAYSMIAATRGLDMQDVYDAACTYSEEADELLTQVFSNMDINEFFSNLSEDEIVAYFSNLDEVEAEVLYSALNDADETYTFSEVDDICNEVYSELELAQPIDEMFSDMTEDEVIAFFSELTDQEANVIFSALDSDETVSFSEVNEALAELNMPLTEMFSDMTEEEVKEYSETVGEDIANIAFSMAADESENYTFSDLLDVVDQVYTFSEADAEQVNSNLENIKKACDDMEKNNDPELAKKVKVLADATAEDIKKAEDAGYDAEKAKEMCQQFSEAAAKVLDANGVKPEEVNAEEVMKSIEADAKKEEKAAEEPKKEEPKKEEPKSEEKPVEDPKKDEKPAEDPKKEEPKKEEPKAEETKQMSDSKFHSTFFGVRNFSKNDTEGSSVKAEKDTMRVFSKPAETRTTTNPCLLTKIN